jgi:LysM repeat protein
MAITVGLISLLLVILAFVWALWLIFRKGDMVTQPVKMIGYFIGALLAMAIAGFLTVWIFPAWANQLLGTAQDSPSVQGVQQKVDKIFQQQFVYTPTPTRLLVLGPSPVGTPAPVQITPQAFGEQEYIVKRGDTLNSIARQFGVTTQSIQTRNNIADPNKLSVGMKLIIPR